MAKGVKKEKKVFNYSPGAGLNVRLKGKLISDNKISLYLEYYLGYYKSDDGKIKLQRKTEYLKKYLFSKPGSPDETTHNKEVKRLSQSIRSKRESEFLHNAEGFVSPHKKKSNFFDFCKNFETTYNKKDIRMVEAAIREFKAFTGESYLLPKQLDKKMITAFRDYLLKKHKGETPHSYFARFKKILRAATEDGYFSKSPAEGISCPVPDGISKAILTADEVVDLAKTEYNKPIIQRAFLFCLMTGLRFDDVEKLKFGQIENKQVKKIQGKTGKYVYIDLNESAQKLVGEIGKADDLVFDLPTYETCVTHLKNWAKAAGINKNVTWHSARHTVGTLLLMNGSNIITVKNVLGHTNLEHTQRYTHVVDELKKKAVDGLPQIKLK